MNTADESPAVELTATGGVKEDAFLAPISEALVERGPRVDLPDPGPARAVEPGHGTLDRFIETATEAGAKVQQIDTAAAAAEHVLSIVRAAGASRVLVAPEAIPARSAIVAQLESAGLTFIDPDDSDAAFDAEVGITGARLAVAETGSLALDSGPVQRRMASLAVSIHIAILRTDQIVADLIDWAEAIGSQPPANTVLITGPSKTADIELVLVTGVHGPKEVHVVLLEAEGTIQR